MFRTFATAGALAAALSATPALADGRSHCGWQQGVYVCSSTYETDYSTTYTLCASGGYDAACSTKTRLKDPPPPPKPPQPSVEHSGGVTIFRGHGS